MATVEPHDAGRELAAIHARQVEVLRNAAPPRWYFLGIGLALVASSFGREVHVVPWGIVGFVLPPIALITFALAVERWRSVRVTLHGRRCWTSLASWALGCAALAGGGYLLAVLGSWSYPATVASAVFATAFTVSGPLVMRRIYVSTAAPEVTTTR